MKKTLYLLKGRGKVGVHFFLFETGNGVFLSINDMQETFKRGTKKKKKKRGREKLLTGSLTDLQALIPIYLFVYTRRTKIQCNSI